MKCLLLLSRFSFGQTGVQKTSACKYFSEIKGGRKLFLYLGNQHELKILKDNVSTDQCSLYFDCGLCQLCCTCIYLLTQECLMIRASARLTYNGEGGGLDTLLGLDNVHCTG